MTSKGLTFASAVLLVGASVAFAGERSRSALESIGTPSSIADMNGAPKDAADVIDMGLPGGVSDTFTIQTSEGVNINPNDIPAGGLTIPAEGSFRGGAESHNQPLQACKVYSDLATFTADHGNFTRAPCSTGGPGQCLENFDLFPNNAAGITLCTNGADLTCQANACAAANAMNFGLAIRETEISRSGTQTGLLQEGPGFFGNATTIDGKAIINNFFNDAMTLRFVGDPLFPAACAASIVAPTVVGFDLINIQNAAVNDNRVTVTLADGTKFVYMANGQNSATDFTGICCNQAIRNVNIQNVGNFGEGVDNVRYGASGTCTRGVTPVTLNQVSDAAEAIEVKLDNFVCTGGGSTKN